MKKLALAIFIGAFMGQAAAARSFKILCSSGKSTEGAEQSADSIAQNLNEQLKTLSESSTIFEVSAPMVTSSVGAGGNYNPNLLTYSRLVCVTVTFQNN